MQSESETSNEAVNFTARWWVVNILISVGWAALVSATFWLCVSILAVVLVESPLESADGTPLFEKPWTFYFLWEIAAVWATFKVAKAFHVKNWGLILVVTMWPMMLMLLLLTNPLSIFHPRYVSSEYKPESLHLVRDKSHPEFERFAPHAIVGSHVRNLRGHLFWQTALAEGYDTRTVPQYTPPTGFFDHVELIFSVGPLVVVEKALVGVGWLFLPLFILSLVCLKVLRGQLVYVVDASVDWRGGGGRDDIGGHGADFGSDG